MHSMLVPPALLKHSHKKLTVKHDVFQEKLWQMFSNWMLQSKEFNLENFNTFVITVKGHASKQELHG